MVAVAEYCKYKKEERGKERRGEKSKEQRAKSKERERDASKSVTVAEAITTSTTPHSEVLHIGPRPSITSRVGLVVSTQCCEKGSVQLTEVILDKRVSTGRIGNCRVP